MTGVVASPFHGKHEGQKAAVRMAGVPAPHRMVRVTENDSLSVPKAKIFVATGIVTTENWPGESAVVIGRAA